MNDMPPCLKCNSELTYEYDNVYVCPECAHEWSKSEMIADDRLVVHDANGNLLNDGDFVTVIKDLKVKGASSTIKVGMKVKIIRLTEGDHNIDCRIDGVGLMSLKSEFVKKQNK